MKYKSFTLIELLVVIAIIGLLVIIIAIPINRVRRGASIARILQYEASLHRYLGADIVGWWQFNEGEGSVAYDISGHNNHGTLINNPQWVDGVPGKEGSALEFNGNNDYIGIPHNNSLNSAMGKTETFTISAWIYPTAWVNFGAINKAPGGCWGNTTNGLWTSALGFRCVMGHGNPNLCNPSGGQIILTHDAELNNWYHVVCTGDGNRLSMYINGEKKGNRNISNITVERMDNQSDLIIGRRTAGSSGSVSGFIDDVKIYSNGLSAEEINTLYAETKNKYFTEEL